jgi:hypothetical protein
MSGASYAVLDEPTPGVEKGAASDPLYHALLGGNIGSTLGAAKEDLTRNTLDEPVSETLVNMQICQMMDRIEI